MDFKVNQAMSPIRPLAASPSPAESRSGRRGFTLVELLVVIVIIGILASLITVAAVSALRAAQRTRIKLEIDNMAGALETYRDKSGGAYPPNAVADFGEHVISMQQAALVRSDLIRHLKQAFPRHREPDSLVGLLIGQSFSGDRELPGGMTASEALVFWLSGASADPKYPISGEGGPSYPIPALGNPGNAALDPIDSRSWVFPFDLGRLGPRNSNDGIFSGRFIEYSVVVNGQQQARRINFWEYAPSGSEIPYVYFDTSRHTPDVLDPPASPAVHVHALKRLENAGSANEKVLYVTPDSFQILHCGIDGDWGDFERCSFAAYQNPEYPGQFLAYPEGPFMLEMADTLVNFTEGKLEDAQP